MELIKEKLTVRVYSKFVLGTNKTNFGILCELHSKAKKVCILWHNVTCDFLDFLKIYLNCHCLTILSCKINLLDRVEKASVIKGLNWKKLQLNFSLSVEGPILFSTLYSNISYVCT